MENKKSPTRTFFILHRETILEAPPRFELGIKVLQTFALPLGYSADWSGLRGSNSLPPPWQGGALPDELNPQWRSGWDSNPRPLPWQGSVLTNWTTRPIWWELQGSNLWPSACKADALPAELSSHHSVFSRTFVFQPLRDDMYYYTPSRSICQPLFSIFSKKFF